MLFQSGHREDIISSLINNQSFPPMAARKDQMEDYLFVLDNDDGALQNCEMSQKKRKSLIVPNGFHLSTEIPSKESTLCLNNCEAEESKVEPATFVKNRSLSVELLSNMDSPQLTLQPQMCHITEARDESPSNDYSSPGPDCTDENSVRTLTNSGYVDIERQEIIQKVDDRQEDYSKVSGADGDNVLLLQIESVSLSTSCGERGNCHADRTNQTPKEGHMTERANTEVCTDVPNSAYVEVSLPPHHPASKLGSDIS